VANNNVDKFDSNTYVPCPDFNKLRIFTNGIEWLGRKIGVGDGVVGSIFSAVGTCLPETMIPIIAILFWERIKSQWMWEWALFWSSLYAEYPCIICGWCGCCFVQVKKGKYGIECQQRHCKPGHQFFIVAYSVGVTTAFINIDS